MRSSYGASLPFMFCLNSAKERIDGRCFELSAELRRNLYGASIGADLPFAFCLSSADEKK